jgi:hypothetical protein
VTCRRRRHVRAAADVVEESMRKCTESNLDACIENKQVRVGREAFGAIHDTHLPRGLAIVREKEK